MAFAKMQQWLEPAKLQFACSASYLDAIDAINLTDEQPSFPTRNYGDILGRRYYVGLNARF